jgi:hypothetical protein
MKLLEIQMQKLLTMQDAELAAEIQAKSPRQVMSEFLFALGQLVVHHGVQHGLTDLSVNFHGGALRLDIAKLTPDGQRLEQWLLGLNANIADVAHLGDAVSLPAQGRVN